MRVASKTGSPCQGIVQWFEDSLLIRRGSRNKQIFVDMTHHIEKMIVSYVNSWWGITSLGGRRWILPTIISRHWKAQGSAKPVGWRQVELITCASRLSWFQWWGWRMYTERLYFFFRESLNIIHQAQWKAQETLVRSMSLQDQSEQLKKFKKFFISPTFFLGNTQTSKEKIKLANDTLIMSSSK